MADPMDFFAIDDLRLSTGFQIETAIATKDDILRAINKYYDIDEGFEELLGGSLSEGEETVQDETMTAEDSPIVRLVNQLLSNAVCNESK